MVRPLMAALVCCLTFFASFQSSGQTPGTSGYALVDSIKLGGEGGWDYLIADSGAHRLYVSRGTHVMVVDLSSNTVVGDIANTPGVHGIALAFSVGEGYTSNGRDSSVTVFDLKTLKTVTTVGIDGRNPDAIIYDPATDRVFTFNGGSSNSTAIDVHTHKVVGTVPLSGRPEFAVSDGLGRIYVNIEDKSEVESFDARTLKPIATWPLAPGEGPSGLSMDRQHRRLFSGCGNKLMIVLDADSGTVLAKLPIGEGVDATAYDAAAGLAFSSNGRDGTLTVVREESPAKFSVVENVPTRLGARTMALDEATHRIYLSTASLGPAPAPTPEHPRPRPVIIPGSFIVLVAGR